MLRVAGVSGRSTQTASLPLRVAGVSARSVTPRVLGVRVAHVHGVSFQTPEPVWFIDHGAGWVPYVSTRV